MPMLLRIEVEGAKPLRAGSEFFWSTLTEASRDGGSMSRAELEGACDPYQENSVREFLVKMRRAGFVERIGDRPPYRFRIARPQRDCPMLTVNGAPSKVGLPRQQMWNVMRRERLGFTVVDLAIAASTEEVTVSKVHAHAYCRLLARAGVLKIMRQGSGAGIRSIYVLTGTGNSGPKAPRRMRADVVYDPNRLAVVGDVVAEEERS